MRGEPVRERLLPAGENQHIASDIMQSRAIRRSSTMATIISLTHSASNIFPPKGSYLVSYTGYPHSGYSRYALRARPPHFSLPCWSPTND